MFDAGHGTDVVSQFVVNGRDHDTLSFARSDFHNSITAVLHNTINTPQGAIIFDPVTGDIVRLTGVTKADLANHTGDFTFHR